MLEIGAGWGSFAIMAASRTGCCVTTVTLSQEQKLFAEERTRKAGVSDKVAALMADNRELDRAGLPKQFDKIVNIEMI